MQHTPRSTVGRPAGAGGFPLAPEEVARFVAGWLSASGRPRALIEPEAVLALARHSEGSLHRVEALAEAAVAAAAREGASIACRRHVDQAASAGDGTEHDTGGAAPAGTASVEASAARMPLGRRVARWAAAAVVAVLLAAGAGWAFSQWLFSHDQRKRVADTSRPAVLPRDEAGSPVATEPPVQPQAPAREAERPEPSRADAGGPGPAPGVPPTASASVAPDAPAEASRPAPPDPLPDLLLSGAPVLFRGVVTNETMGQSGQMSLVITRQGPGSAVTAQFRAWGGLIGAGELTGRMSQDGRLSLSGQLMMGRNPFDCELSGRVAGERLQGSATFARTGGSYVTRSSFTLART